MKHWRKRTTNGIRFYFRAAGQTMSGWCPDEWAVDGLQEMFEQSTGCKLPDPEWRS